MNTQTGSYIAIAGLIASVLAHFNIVIGQDSIIAIVSGVVALYGVIHQYVITRKVVKIAKSEGVAGF